ncbi:PAS domain S-box protein [Longimicrobium terrae]|uniref:histidine kinase n=1 Tax=Longimicrobium terrae TaxID=1639882 RepID=A0A841H343_9BACT|nr:PAS domain S-box protein [Longimicrobium terrae]MBB4638016.1 PAS domain S-box-containing protein [Longimicrobium terrae]MBB6072388.1 PAS domain S-box-containing protein [Longimicrobium terrae]NNC32198.1 PAS domain S-box protein [Longimicrobium terrae]
MQSTSSPIPVISQTLLDAALLELARRVPASSFAAEIRCLLRVAAMATDARSASLWLCADDGQTLRCAERFHTDSATWDKGAESRGAWPGTSSLAERRWATDHLARLSAEGGADVIALDAGVWSGGALAGFIRLERGADRPWTDAEGAFSATLADRAGAAYHASAGMDADARPGARGEDGAEPAAGVGSREEDGTADRAAEQAEAEAALRASEESYRTIFQTSNDAIFITDPVTGAMVDANDRACELVAASRDELRRDPAAILWNGPAPFTPELAMEQTARAMAGEAQRFEWMSIHRHTGGEVWGEVSLQRVVLNGQDRVMAVVRDIGERKRAEQALRTSEESYRAIFESSNDAIFVHDLATGAVLDANARACELGGVSLDELRASGLGVIASGPPPFTEERAAEYLQKAATGEPQRFEWMTPHPETGEEMWVEVGLQRVSIRGEERLLALVRDIRERKAAEEAMRQSELSYRTLFQISSEAMWVHDLETGAFLEVNQAACDLYGYTEEETLALGVEGISWDEAPYTIEHAREYIRRAVAGEPQRFEWKGRRKDGKANWADMQLRRVTINGVDRLLANGRDISDRLRYEAELRRANEQLELRVAERTGELAAANEALEEEVAEHEAAKEALLERTHEVEGIFRALPDLFFRLGPDGTILDYRAGSHNKLAVPPEVFMWKRIQDVLPPVADATMAALERAVRTNQLASFEYQLPTPAGMGDYEARVVPVPDGTFITVIRDVTDAKTAQRALQESEERFRRMVANTYDIITLLEADGSVRYENDAMTRLLGWTSEERVGRSIADNIHPDDLPVVREALSRIVATPGQAVTVEYRYRAKDGTLHYLESVGRTMSEHTAAEGVVANSRDVTESRAVQRALKESEEHFRTLIENSSDVATINDAVTGAVLYASPAAEVVLSWTPDELEGTTAADFVHPDDVHAVHERMQELLLDPSQPQTMRYRHRRRDGGWMVLETTARIVVTPDGDYRMVANARDVTDRTRAEEALRRNEEHFRALIENAQDIVLILDATGRMTYLSPPIERILGWSPAELTDRSAFEYMHPEDQPIVAGELARVLAEPGLTGNAEYRFRDKRGRWRYMEAFGRVLETGGAGIPSIVANVRDVTERHEAAEALRKSEEHFRALTENASDLITVLSAEGTYLYQSPSVLRLLGFTPADMLGVTPFGFMHPDDVEAARESLRRMAGEPGTSHTVQIRFRHADGAWRVLESVGRTLLPDSADEGIVVISRDVTERRRTEEALRAATEAAERANRAKSEFLSRMSHELRTPMNSILGFAQLLGRAELPSNDQKSVQHILKAGRHLLNLINEVLEIARIEAGRHNLSLEPVRVTPLVEEALGLVRPMAAQWGVVLEHGPAPRDAFVRADRQRLAQVLLNLLSNAIKYNRPGGRVRLWCEPSADGHLVIRVEDEGRGIPAENAEQLFTPFARLGAESTGVEGTGLGLALSQRLTEAMGGALTLERSSDEGSVFRVELGGASDPLDALDGAEAGGSRAVPAGHGTATLLYVEDNLANLSLVETILLSRPGWRTLPALQGQIGVELAREHRPDLILLDLHLPDIPGEEVLRRLRSDGRTAGIPIVVISADATRATAERLRALGADAYLSKPIDVDEFLETVERFLAAREGL